MRRENNNFPEFETVDYPTVGSVVGFGSSCIEDFFQAQQNQRLVQEAFPAATAEKITHVIF